MAFRRYGKWQNRAYGGFNSRRRRFARRVKGPLGIGMPYVGGAALGYLAPRVHPLQDMAITLLAVLPIRLPRYVGPLAKGYVLGTMARSFMPNVAGIPAASGGADFV
jgi:hypothetical protein